jgi:ligand-binding SRPBCC domain-containing protein
MSHLQVSEIIPASRFEVFDYLTDPKNVPFLLEPGIQVEVLTPEAELKRGAEIQFMMTRFGLKQSIRFHIEDVVPGSRLTYRQSEGVFAGWTHTMRFEEHGDKSTVVTDLVDYQVPLGLLGYLADDLLIKGDMKRLLENRLHKVMSRFSGV